MINQPQVDDQPILHHMTYFEPHFQNPTLSTPKYPSKETPPHPKTMLYNHRLLNPLPQKLTISSSYESRGFKFHRTPSGLDLNHLNKVFVSVGFPRRDIEKIQIALDHTDSLLWVEHCKTQKPVAFARATGDGVFNAIIWDVVVDPSFQGIGLGKEVVERVIEDLVGKGIGNVALYSEPRVLGFYRPLGFVSDPDGIKGMVYSRKQNDSKKKK